MVRWQSGALRMRLAGLELLDPCDIKDQYYAMRKALGLNVAACKHSTQLNPAPPPRPHNTHSHSAQHHLHDYSNHHSPCSSKKVVNGDMLILSFRVRVHARACARVNVYTHTCRCIEMQIHRQVTGGCNM
jgi:hypothetical protein